MRVINFNIKGAPVPGRKDHATQQRSWHLLAAYGADVALVQEVEMAAIPAWAREHWQIIQGSWNWGSVIAARSVLNLRACPDLQKERWIDLLDPYTVLGEIDMPGGTPTLVASIHAPARRLTEYLDILDKPGAITSEGIAEMAQGGGDPWAIDLMFAALSPVMSGRRFLIGGDWNNSRLFDLDDAMRKRGQLPFSTMFFTNARDAGWFECHGAKNEEQSYFAGKRPHQLDHLFCDWTTGERMKDCCVRADWIAPELSDHAPIVTDFVLE